MIHGFRQWKDELQIIFLNSEIENNRIKDYVNGLYVLKVETGTRVSYAFIMYFQMSFYIIFHYGISVRGKVIKSHKHPKS